MGKIKYRKLTRLVPDVLSDDFESYHDPCRKKSVKAKMVGLGRLIKIADIERAEKSDQLLSAELDSLVERHRPEPHDSADAYITGNFVDVETRQGKVRIYVVQYLKQCGIETYCNFRH